MRVTWAVGNFGSGEALVSTADEAFEALRTAVHEVFSDADTQVILAVRRLMQPLRLAMVTDGASAVRNGHSWERSAGPILVKLSPS